MSDRPNAPSGIPQGQPSPAARELAEWCHQLGRLLRLARVHGAASEPVAAGRAKLIDGLRDVTAHHGAIALRVSPNELFLDAEVVSREPRPGEESDGLERERRLPFLLHRGGLRGLTLPAMTERAECAALLDALLSLAQGLPGDEDIVTALWEASLPHIRFEAASLEESLAQHDIVVADHRADSTASAGTAELMSVDDWPQAAVAVDAQGAWESLEAENVERRPAYEAACRESEARAWNADADAFLRGVLANDRSDATREALVSAAQTWLAGAIGRCEADDAERAEALLRELDPQLDGSGAPLRSLLTGLDHGAIAERLEDAEPQAVKRFFALVVRLGSPAIELVVGLLARAGKPRLRAAATTALSYICADHPHWLSSFLRDSRWHVVRNVVFVLGQIGGPEAGALLAGPSRHLDARVRRAVVTAVAQAPSEQRLPLLLGQLDATDSAMLLTVLGMLGRESDPRVAPALLHLIDAPDFDSRPDEAKLAMLATLGDVADDQAVPALAAILNKGGWFARRSVERTAAAYTLARIGTAAALMALREGSKSPAESVRTACLDALTPARAA